ncbi:MAG TPA: ABC transporter substrate-binding protein [Candidatus Sulfotelmatobacter sp.]|nr:ABC transporter substrate-binding protein [Candidatus Sulfotelmatobacter sp.]
MKRLLAVACLLLASASASAAALRIGLQDDPEVLDPAQGVSFVGRIVFAALCDKLVDIDPQLNFVPQLATRWEWGGDGKSLVLALRPGVRFQDGSPLDAAAVKANLDRYRTDPLSKRKAELAPVAAVDVVDPLTVRLVLSQPYAPLLAVLSDRAGMMIAPSAFAEASKGNPVCAGPFRLAERVALDRIVVRRFDGYWNAGAVALDEVVYKPIPDTGVRLVNLQAGSLDMIERLAATDVAAVRADARLRFVETTGLGYNTMSINIAHGSRADTPLGRDPRVREALELAIDRVALNRVVFDGMFVPSNQPLAPGSPYWLETRPVPARDVARAKALLTEAVGGRFGFTLTTPNNSSDMQVAQVIQAMAADAGFDIKIEAIEASTMVHSTEKGDYQAALAIWSGRADPDANISIWLACDGFLNWGKYCDPRLDALLNQAKATTVPAERRALYRQAAERYLDARPHLFLYHFKLLWALSRHVEGFVPYPDGLIRLQGMRVD